MGELAFAEAGERRFGPVFSIDIARLFGWEALHKFYYSYNMDHENEIPHGDQVDIVARLCESAGVDLRPLLHFWGRFNFWDGGNKDSAKAVKLQKLIEEKKLPCFEMPPSAETAKLASPSP